MRWNGFIEMNESALTVILVPDAIKLIQAKGWFYRTDPRVKVIFLVAFTVVNLIFLNPVALFALTACILPIILTTRLNYRLLVMILMGYSLFLFAITVSQGMAPVGRMANPETLHYVFNYGFIHMTWEGLGIGVSRSLRFANPFALGVLIALTTDPVIMARGLIKLGLPFEFAFMMLAGLRFLPLALDEAKNISDAQTVRGMKSRFQRFKTSIFPLFLNSLRRAQRLGITIESKSFGAKNWKGFLRDVKLAPNDAILVTYAVVILAVALYVRFVIGWGYTGSSANPF
jgi:energy-coupling factor transport system permease protein